MRQIILASLVAAVATAQNPTFSADVKVVSLLVTAQDRDGAIVKDLTKDDFAIEDDGRPQVIRYFSKQSDLPLTVGLLVDTSNSQRYIIPDERNASLAFLNRVLRDGIDRASVVSFDEGVHLYQPTTASRAASKPGSISYRVPGGPQRSFMTPSPPFPKS